MVRYTLITGKIGSGKSMVSDLLRKKHYIVIDSDTVVKEIYNEPNIFCQLLNHFPFIYQDGKLDMNYIRQVIMDNDQKDRIYLMNLIIPRLIEKITQKYENSNEMIFIEAALTQELGRCINDLHIHKVIFVNTNDDIRKERLLNRGLSLENIQEFDKIQDERYIKEYWKDGQFFCNIENLNIFPLNNDCSIVDLNDKLMVILENLGIIYQEKLATYIRYLKECPSYCPENAWCYSFYNSCGCNGCPFPCNHQDKYWEKLNKKFIENRIIK